MTTSESTRWVDLQGTKNCRDLGQIPTPHGHVTAGAVFRSDALHRLTGADHATLTELELGAIIDLRMPFEKKRAPNALSKSLAERQRARPFLPTNTHAMFERVNAGDITAHDIHETMCNNYRILTTEHTNDYRQLLTDLLGLKGRPLLVHCTSGKDRTGMFCAVLLAAVGVNEADIIDDYTMTNGRIPPIDYLDQRVDRRIIDAIMAANPDYMAAAFATMRGQFGSVDNYLRDGIGLSDAERDQLCETLVV